MFQVKILKANQIEILEEIMNMWLKNQTDVNVVDIKFNSISSSDVNEFIAIMIYQTA